MPIILMRLDKKGKSGKAKQSLLFLKG